MNCMIQHNNVTNGYCSLFNYSSLQNETKTNKMCVK